MGAVGVLKMSEASVYEAGILMLDKAGVLASNEAGVLASNEADILTPKSDRRSVNRRLAWGPTLRRDP
jgi:hypothetical protein